MNDTLVIIEITHEFPLNDILTNITSDVDSTVSNNVDEDGFSFRRKI